MCRYSRSKSKDKVLSTRSGATAICAKIMNLLFYVSDFLPATFIVSLWTVSTMDSYNVFFFHIYIFSRTLLTWGFIRLLFFIFFFFQFSSFLAQQRFCIRKSNIIFNVTGITPSRNI